MHTVNQDGKIIPFGTMNLFYRDGLEEKPKAIRKRIRPEAAVA